MRNYIILAPNKTCLLARAIPETLSILQKARGPLGSFFDLQTIEHSLSSIGECFIVKKIAKDLENFCVYRNTP